jgi:hypothetical protein
VLCVLHQKIARYDSLLNAKLPTTDNKHSIWFEKNINNYDLDRASGRIERIYPQLRQAVRAHEQGEAAIAVCLARREVCPITSKLAPAKQSYPQLAPGRIG